MAKKIVILVFCFLFIFVGCSPSKPELKAISTKEVNAIPTTFEDEKTTPMPPLVTPKAKDDNAAKTPKIIDVGKYAPPIYRYTNSMDIRDEHKEGKEKVNNVELMIYENSITIQGLKDLSVASTINKKIKTCVENGKSELITEAKKCIAKTTTNQSSQSSISFEMSVAANYNNILSIQIFENLNCEDQGVWFRKYLTFDLNTGNTLKLKDLLRDNVDYINVFNQAIRNKLFMFDEESPMFLFDSITGSEEFCLTQNSVEILLELPGTDPIPVTVLFPELGSLVNVYQKFFNEGKTIFQVDKKDRFLLSYPFSSKPKEIKTEIGSASFDELSNNYDKGLENKINSEITRRINASNLDNKVMTLNILCGRVLSLTSYDSYILIDINTMKEIPVKNLFKQGFDYKKLFEEQLIKDNSATKLTYKELSQYENKMSTTLSTTSLGVKIDENVFIDIPINQVIDQLNIAAK